MAIYLGIDGGGSKTSCWIGDENSLIGRGRAEGSNIVRVGEAKAGEALARAVSTACAEAKISPKEVDFACIGLAGAARPEISAAVHRIMSAILSSPLDVVGDMVIAMEAAFGGGLGVITISGTGSISYARDSHGQTVRVGGWGPAVSDEGSAHWIGKTAVAAALRGFDEGQQTILLAAIMKAWQVETPAQTVAMANAAPAPDFAGLCPGVCLAADLGDATARQVLAKAGEELATLSKIAMKRLFDGKNDIPVGMAGSVFMHSHIVREKFTAIIRDAYPTAVIQPSVVEPVKGALDIARKSAQEKAGAKKSAAQR